MVNYNPIYYYINLQKNKKGFWLEKMKNAKLTFYKKEIDNKTKIYEVSVDTLCEFIESCPLGSATQIINFMRFILEADCVEYTATSTGFEFISNIKLEFCRNDNIMHSEYQEIINLDILNTNEPETYHHYGYEYPKSLKLKSEYEILVDIDTKQFCIRPII